MVVDDQGTERALIAVTAVGSRPLAAFTSIWLIDSDMKRMYMALKPIGLGLGSRSAS